MTIGKRYFTVREAIFRRRVHVFINYSDKEFSAWSKRKGWGERKKIETPNFKAWSAEVGDDEGFAEWLICIHDFDWRISDQGTLIHEIVHTIIKIWKINNISVNVETQEFFAHSIGNLYEEIAAKLMRVKPIKKRKSGK